MPVCTYVQYIGIAHSINMFPRSVGMSSLLAEICSRQEAWMEMRTGTFVNPPQDTGTMYWASHRRSRTNVRLKNIVDCMQWLSYVLCHSCLSVVRRPLVVAATVGEDEETPPPSTPLSVSTLLSRCVQFMCMHSSTYIQEIWLCFEHSFGKLA